MTLGTRVAFILRSEGRPSNLTREIETKMKKLISTVVMGMILAAAVPLMSVTARAQTRYCESNRREDRRESRRERRNYTTRYYGDGYNNTGSYNTANYRAYNTGRPNVYQRHRQAINIGAATGAGAILGALIGGRKGALIGAAAGAGGGYIFTKKQSPKNYYRYNR